MRTSWRRQPLKGNNLTSWTEAYRVVNDGKQSIEVLCLYEDVSPGYGESVQEAKNDYLENIRLKIMELTEMLEFCAKNEPKCEPSASEGSHLSVK
jgi:hypothetical protein